MAISDKKPIKLNIDVFVWINRFGNNSNLNKTGEEKVAKKISSFYEDVSELVGSKPAFRVKENNGLAIRVSKVKGRKDVRLYLDGFDGLSNKKILHMPGTYENKKDNGDIQWADIPEEYKYLAPSEKYTDVFDYKNFPLPPGSYVMVLTVDGRKYYQGFEVIANTLEDNNTWKYMLLEILENNPEQAVIYSYLNSKQYKSLTTDVPPSMLLKVIELLKAFDKVITAIRDINNNPHIRLIKEYKPGNPDERDVEDYHSIKKNTVFGSQGNLKIMPYKTVSYDLQENRYLKKILIRLKQYIDQCQTELLYTRDEMQREVDNPYGKNAKQISRSKQEATYIRQSKAISPIDKYCTEIGKLKNAITLLINAEWMESVRTPKVEIMSGQSLSDPRYNVIYKLYNSLNQTSRIFSENANLIALWKQTSTLYEYWCILKILQTSVELGFNLESSNIANENYGKVILRRLESGAGFVLHNECLGLTIKLYYDKLIPILNNKPISASIISDKGLNKITNPLYTVGPHNRPDCIIDVYSKNSDGITLYLGALIIDFKYRKKYSFWDDTFKYISPNLDGDQKKNKKPKHSNHQFLSYKNEIKSVYYGECDGSDGNMSDLEYLNVVHEVWAMYPENKPYDNNIYERGLGIRLISNFPGKEGKLKLSLKRFFEQFAEDGMLMQ